MKLTPTDYLLLAHLRAEPTYTYNLADKLHSEGVDLWCRFSDSHLYYTLRKLLKNNLVEVEVKPIKGRPPQKIYSITGEGEDVLDQLVNSDELVQSDQYFEFDLLLGLANRLGLDDTRLVNMITERIDFLRELLDQIQDKFREKELQSGGISSGEKIAYQHRIRFFKNEIDFYRKSLKGLK